MLGRAMMEVLASRGADVLPVTRDRFDLAAPTSVAEAIPDDLDLVFNCAAYTDVDGAERQPELADAVNGRGVGTLAQRCRAVNATLVTFGTDYVFDGKATAPYRVDEPLRPSSAYGRSKAIGERLVAESGARHLIIRTSWLYAPWGSNFVLTMARLTRERDSLRVVDDQRGRPTSSRHLARTTLALVDRGAEGVFHVTDGGQCTWYELATLVRDHLGNACEIEPCTSDELPRPAPRPAYSVLDLSATEALLGPMPHYRDSVPLALDAAQAAESTS
jgi:dTDP-4-dehydrorhamnose reductase